MGRYNHYDAELKGLHDMIDDCCDGVLIEGLEYYFQAMIKRMPEFEEQIGLLQDSYLDLIDAVSDADAEERRFERLEDMEIIDRARAEKGMM